MDLSLNSASGDVELASGDLKTVVNQDAVAQFIRQRLRLFLGEWFLDESVGVPWFDQIMVKNPNAALVDSLLKQVILQTTGVVELMAFSMDLNPSTRKLTVTATVRSQDGEIRFSDTVGV